MVILPEVHGLLIVIPRVLPYPDCAESTPPNQYASTASFYKPSSQSKLPQTCKVQSVPGSNLRGVYSNSPPKNLPYNFYCHVCLLHSVKTSFL